jgi:fructose/tagatose bisphosphate aldolase
LHGGSGTPDDDIKRTVELGICKVNIFSEVLQAFFTSLKAELNSLSNMSTWPCVVFEKPVLAMKEMIGKKITLFGSAGKA